MVSVQARVTTEEIMAALEQLNAADADKVTLRLLHLQARRRAANLSASETELLLEIYCAKRPGFQVRFDLLNSKRRAFTLNQEEHEELLSLVDESETFASRRVAAIGQLAALREVPVAKVMKQLGLKAPPVV